METSFTIRSKYLEFFKGKGHTIVPSDTLVPRNDPTLLFTSAGMNQFKEQFIGKDITYTRATSCQKCLRTGDLDNVGRTAGHHTFFEMLGNFSFGDYFKKEACLWAWEFMTGWLNVPENKLWVSVYKDDAEAAGIWKNTVGVSPSRIVNMGAKDNFWPSNAPDEGPNGPCGPCSEIYFDRGANVGCGKPGCNPECSCGRFIEVWNLVFTQFNRIGVRQLEPLPSKNIDTGMGLERITAVMQGVMTNFETDLFVPITSQVRAMDRGLENFAVNAIADHLRASVFSICDGISPSNEERGYVVRKLIRRAFLLGKSGSAFLYMLVPVVVKVMGDVYPVLRSRREDITAVVKEEEERFSHTLTSAMPKLDEIIVSTPGKVVPGSEIFRLVDTYGLPLEVIEDKVAPLGIGLDLDGFKVLMEERKELSRKKSKMETNIFVEGVFSKAPLAASVNEDPLKAKIAFMASGDEEIKEAGEGDRIGIVTDPLNGMFYSESGGQVGDTGIINFKGGFCDILNTYKVDGRVVHDCMVRKGTARLGEEIIVQLNAAMKVDVARNHTATHLLHSALRKVLGDHVHQSGSLVDARRFRFDFTHIKKLSDDEIERVEDYVNGILSKAVQVNVEVKDRAQAEKDGAMALFGEKYGDNVRVVSVGEYSMELCGGSHVGNTREIGIFKITSESSIASGIRRIEGVTGSWFLEWLKQDIDSVLARLDTDLEALGPIKEALSIKANVSQHMNRLSYLRSNASGILWVDVKEYFYTIKPDILEAVDALGALKKAMAKKGKEDVITGLLDEVRKSYDSAAEHNGVKLVKAHFNELDAGTMRQLAEKAAKDVSSTAFVFASVYDGKANLIVSITPDVESRGADAGAVVKESSKLIDGSGGGRKNFAQAGGKKTEGLEAAVDRAVDILKGLVDGK